MFHYKPSILGYPHFRKSPSILAKNHQTLIVLGVTNPLSITRHHLLLTPYRHGSMAPAPRFSALRGGPQPLSLASYDAALEASVRGRRLQSAVEIFRQMQRDALERPPCYGAMGCWAAGHRGRVNCWVIVSIPIGSMYAIYGNIYHQYTPNVNIYTIHGSYGIWV